MQATVEQGLRASPARRSRLERDHAIQLPPLPELGEISFEDYLQMPEERRRYDIIDGVMIMSPAPSFDHQMDLADAYDLIKAFVETVILGSYYSRHLIS